jgi:hypothetical protein
MNVLLTFVAAISRNGPPFHIRTVALSVFASLLELTRSFLADVLPYSLPTHPPSSVYALE